MSESLHAINEEQNTKDKIFMVAARLIAEKGYNGVSMREISEQSGVSKPTIYYYFGSKEGVYKELLTAGLAHITENMKRIQALNIPVKAKLVTMVKNHFQQCRDHPEFIKMIFSLLNRIEEMDFLKSFQRAANEKRQILIDMIQEGVDSGEFGANANPGLAAEIIAGTLSHFFWRQTNCDAVILTDQLAEEIIEILFKGLNE